MGELFLMLRRLHPDQPESFAFTPANLAWAQRQIAKYPEGRQASAVIPLLWRAQEQEGWVSRPAIEHIAGMLGIAYIRVLEVATFYFMFQLQPVGSVAVVQVCGTTSCMLCGAEDLIAVCRERIAPSPHEVSADGTLMWEEVECLGACSNAPMAQIGKDYYEDLTPERFGEIIDALKRGEVPRPGPQTGRFASEPAGGLTSLKGETPAHAANASITLAETLGDTVKRITGDEPPPPRPEVDRKEAEREVAPISRAGATEEADVDAAPVRPAALDAPRDGQGDDLTLVKGIGHALAARLNGLGIHHLDQIAGWGPAQVAWIEANVEGGNRIESDGWVEQARALAEKAGTAYEQRLVEGEDRPAAADRGTGAAFELPPERVMPERPAETVGVRPAGIDAPRASGPDDLKRIKGVGPKLEAMLHGLGFYHFDQIAAWTPEAVAWVDSHLEGLSGRVSRDDWVGQAKALASGGDSDVSKRADDGEVR
jgi:NADH-quinone oxidoreductase subunit E